MQTQLCVDAPTNRGIRRLHIGSLVVYALLWPVTVIALVYDPGIDVRSFGSVVMAVYFFGSAWRILRERKHLAAIGRGEKPFATMTATADRAEVIFTVVEFGEAPRLSIAKGAALRGEAFESKVAPIGPMHTTLTFWAGERQCEIVCKLALDNDAVKDLIRQIDAAR